jgi:hypothetical protein
MRTLSYSLFQISGLVTEVKYGAMRFVEADGTDVVNLVVVGVQIVTVTIGYSDNIKMRKCEKKILIYVYAGLNDSLWQVHASSRTPSTVFRHPRFAVLCPLSAPLFSSRRGHESFRSPDCRELF